MAASLIKGDTEDAANIELWQDLNGFLAEKYPEAAMVSEWGEPEHAVQGGFHMDFLLHFGPSRYMDLFRTENPYFSKEGKGDIKPFVDRYKETYDSIYGKGYISIPSGNHDMVRIAGKLDEEECRIIFAFLMSMPGVPFVYYGDEIGMRYIEGLTSVEGGYFRTGSRSPMQWDSSKNAGFSTADSDKIYITQNMETNKRSVESEEADPNSLLHFVRGMLKLRASSEALGNDGDWKLVSSLDQPYPMVYERWKGEDKCLVVINPSAKKVSVELPTYGVKNPEVVGGSYKKVTYKAGKETDKITIDGVSAVVYHL
jgi:maltose alpha-D-glucosyltransferase/alpha-amylase